MTLPANIRVNVSAPFPALVTASAPATITKKNGIWTIGWNIGNLGTLVPQIADYPNDFLVFWNSVTNTHYRIPLSAFPVLGRSQRSIVAGPIVFAGSDQILNVNLNAAFVHTLPPFAARLGVPITIKDAGRKFNQFAQTIQPTAGEAIEGVANQQIVLNGRGSSTTFVPYNDGTNQGWAIE